jgi:hypothetical protein
MGQSLNEEMLFEEIINGEIVRSGQNEVKFISGSR